LADPKGFPSKRGLPTLEGLFQPCVKHSGLPERWRPPFRLNRSVFATSAKRNGPLPFSDAGSGFPYGTTFWSFGLLLPGEKFAPFQSAFPAARLKPFLALARSGLLSEISSAVWASGGFDCSGRPDTGFLFSAPNLTGLSSAEGLTIRSPLPAPLRNLSGANCFLPACLPRLRDPSLG